MSLYKSEMKADDDGSVHGHKKGSFNKRALARGFIIVFYEKILLFYECRGLAYDVIIYFKHVDASSKVAA